MVLGVGEAIGCAHLKIYEPESHPHFSEKRRYTEEEKINPRAGR